MLLILSHNQVMPSFLDIMFTFRAREKPHTMTRFSYETSLGKAQPKLVLPSLSISGFRIQHCFNLIGVEKSEKPGDPWLIRQTGAYHSFDVVSRRSTWIVLKGNRLIRERLQSSTAGHRKRCPEYALTVQGCFLANLRSHSLIFQWSAENWESYVDHLEEKLRWSKSVAKHTPVLELTKDEGIVRGLEKNQTWATMSSFSRQGTGFSDFMTPPSSPAKSGRTFNMFRSTSGLNSKPNQPTAPLYTAGTAVSERVDNVDLDEMFSFDKLQSLHLLGGQTQEAIHVLGQNKKLLEEVKKYFKSLLNSDSFSSFVDLQDHAEDLDSFFQGISKIIREMEGHQARLQNMLRDLEKDTELVGNILYLEDDFAIWRLTTHSSMPYCSTETCGWGNSFLRRGRSTQSTPS